METPELTWQLFHEGGRWVTLLGPAGSGRDLVAHDFLRAAAAGGHARVFFFNAAGAENAEDLDRAVRVRMGVPPAESRPPARAVKGARPTLVLLEDVGALRPGVMIEGLLAELPQVHVLLTSEVPLGRPGEMTVEVALPIVADRGLLEDSFAALKSEEREALVQLSVFAGSFSPEAAAAFLGHRDGGQTARELLAQPLRRDLLRKDPSPVSHERLYLPGKVRAFARRLLEAQGLLGAALRRHAGYLASLHTTEEPRVNGGSADPFDLLAAFRRFSDEDPQVAAQILLTAAPWLSATRPPAEVLLFLEQFSSERAYLLDPPSRQMVCRVHAQMRRVEGRLQDAARLLEQALSFSVADDRSTEVVILRDLGVMLREAGQLDRARRRLEECVRRCDQTVAARLVALAHRSLGSLHRHTGDFAAARRCYQSAFALLDDCAPVIEHAIVQVNLAHLDFAEGRWQEAQVRFTGVLPQIEAESDHRTFGHCLIRLAVVQLELGAPADAPMLLERALEPLSTARDEVGLSIAHLHLAWIHRSCARLEEASSHLAQARAGLDAERDRGRFSLHLQGALQVASALESPPGPDLPALEQAGATSDDLRYLVCRLLEAAR